MWETEGKGGKVWENLGTHLGFLVIREGFDTLIDSSIGLIF